MEFANKTEMSLALMPLSVDSSNINATDQGQPVTLDDLARLSYIRGVVRYKVAGMGGGAIRLEVLDGADVALASVDVTVDSEGSMGVPLASVTGSEGIKLKMSVQSVGAGTVTAAGVLSVEHPLVIGSC